MRTAPTCERCAEPLPDNYLVERLSAVHQELTIAHDGTGMTTTLASALACSWNCLAVLAAQRAGTDADAAVQMVAERERQVTGEHWAPEHDDRHDTGELAAAGVCYVVPHAAGWEEAPGDDNSPQWPWEPESWNPKGFLRDLVRGGALIAAEVDRDRRARRTDAYPLGREPF